MVKRLAIVALLALLELPAYVGASESATLASRAQRSISNGKFAKAYSQLERALLASRKESDLLSEGRVLMAMAQIRTMSLDFDLADSLLSVVRPEALDNDSKTNLYKSRMAIANGREKYGEAAKICGEADPDSVKEANENVQAAFFAECAIGYAGNRQNDKATEALKKTASNSDDESGFYVLTKAQMAELGFDGLSGEADSLYRYAEEKSIKGNKSYTTATILYKRSQLKTTSEKDARDLKLRCKNAFDLMGLPNNSKRCGE